MRFIVLVREILFFSFDYNFIWKIVRNIYLGILLICLLHMNCTLGCSRMSTFFLEFLASFEDESTVLPKSLVLVDIKRQNINIILPSTTISS